LIDHVAVVLGDRTDHRLCACRVHAEVAFAENHELLAGNFELRDGFSNDLFAAAVGVDVSLKGDAC